MTRLPPEHAVLGAIQFLRDNWRNDGAEGESVNLVCNELERLRSLLATGGPDCKPTYALVTPNGYVHAVHNVLELAHREAAQRSASIAGGYRVVPYVAAATVVPDGNEIWVEFAEGKPFRASEKCPPGVYAKCYVPKGP